MLLSTLMVLGAQSPEKALAVDELASKLGMETPDLQAELDRVTKGGYAVMVRQEGKVKVYLTATGIITASSAYS